MSTLHDIVKKLDITIDQIENTTEVLSVTTLPISGGVMTGDIVFETGIISSNNSPNEIILFGSSTKSASASKPCIAIRNENHSSDPGSFYIRACHDSKSSILHMRPNGELKWNGSNIITDKGGNFTSSNAVLTFSNRGRIQTWYGNDYHYISMYGLGNSGGFEAFDEDCPTNPRGFNCRARGPNGEFYDLAGRTDGNLWWKGTAVACIVGHWQSGSNWWRKWSDGWIEQGGQWTTSNTTLTFNLAFSNTNYTIVGTENQGDDNARAVKFNRNNATTTSIRMVGSANPIGVCWYACGV